MPGSNSLRFRALLGLLALPWLIGTGQAQGATDLTFESAHNVNEGSLHFLERPPNKPFHHHQNWFRIDEGSLATGWVKLLQCHDNLDAVPRAQITFRDGFVRNLKVKQSKEIENAWVEGPTVQLVNVGRGARLCLEAETRALRDTGSGYFNLYSGPYMRRFLDGYYPMRLTLEVEYPANLLNLLDVSPLAQPGFNVDSTPGRLRMDAVFEGTLQTLAQFEKI